MAVHSVLLHQAYVRIRRMRYLLKPLKTSCNAQCVEFCWIFFKIDGLLYQPIYLARKKKLFLLVNSLVQKTFQLVTWIYWASLFLASQKRIIGICLKRIDFTTGFFGPNVIDHEVSHCCSVLQIDCVRSIFASKICFIWKNWFEKVDKQLKVKNRVVEVWLNFLKI